MRRRIVTRALVGAWSAAHGETAVACGKRGTATSLRAFTRFLRALRVRAAEPVLVPERLRGGLGGARKAGIGYEAKGCVRRDGGGGVGDVVVEEEERVHAAAERG